jgi:Kef-type K+ transport system membrane component KefB
MHDDRLPRIVMGLVLAFGLAVLGAHPSIRTLERRLGITFLITAGLPFLAMGAVFHLPAVGILSNDILRDLEPAFEFGLGWIGFVVGLELDVRTLDKIPSTIAPVIAVETLVPMLTTVLLCALVFLNLGASHLDASLARDLLLLAACAAPSAAISIEAWTPRIGARHARLLDDITHLDEIVTLALLGLISIYFRPPDEATLWRLPSPSAWLLVFLGLGVILGIITYVLIRNAKSAAEELAMILGAVALSAGMAGYLSLSVPVVCTIAGAMLANLPMRDKEGLRRTLRDVERPLYLVFLIVAGASWRPGEWQGWVLAPAFVLARVAGKRLGAIAARRLDRTDELPTARQLALALAPQSPIAVVAIMSAASLYRGEHEAHLRWSLNAVIIGGVLTEIVVRLLERFGGPLRAPEGAAPVSVRVPGQAS